MSEVDMSAAAVSARLRAVDAASDLRRERRLRTKVDMAPAAVSARLRSVGQALELCRRLGQRV